MAQFSRFGVCRAQKWAQFDDDLPPRTSPPSKLDLGPLEVHSTQQTRGLSVIPDEVGMPKVEELAIRALELDATLGEAHALLGNVQRLYHWDWVESEKEYKLALELDPNSEIAHSGYASLLSVMSRYEEAIVQCQAALEMNQSYEPPQGAILARSMKPRGDLRKLPKPVKGAESFKETARKRSLDSQMLRPRVQRATGDGAWIISKRKANSSTSHLVAFL